MTEQNNNSPPNGPTTRRRSSFAGQAFADLFGGGVRKGSTSISEANNSPPAQYSGPITAAAVQANQRRLSLTTIGLGNSPPQNGGYFGNRTRGDSISSSNNASVDESAVDEEPGSATGSQPTTPFGRRVSFGARALRDMNKNGGNNGNNGNNGRVSTSTIPEESTYFAGGDGGGGGDAGGKKGRASPIDVAGSAKITVPTTAKGRESGFNWADNMRTRAERTSISGASMSTSPIMGTHHRAKSVTVMEQPIREAPKPAPRLDHTQERILKGDFYMD